MRGWPAASWTSVLRTKSDHVVSRMRRWQRMWSDSSFDHSVADVLHPRNKKDRLQHEYRLTAVAVSIVSLRQILSRHTEITDAWLWRPCQFFGPPLCLIQK